MANLQALTDYYSQLANNNYGTTYDATKADYETQKSNLLNTFNTNLGQDQQAKAAIPGQYQPQREAANLTMQKANLAIPEQMANAGYASDSGLAYDTRIANNANFGKLVDTANTAQNTAIQSSQNAIDTLKNTYSSNLGSLGTQEAKDLAAIDQAKQAWVNDQSQTAYNNELAAEAAIAKEQADAQEKAYEAQLKYDADIAKNAKSEAEATEKSQASNLKPYITQLTTSYTGGDANNTGDPVSAMNWINSLDLTDSDKQYIASHVIGGNGATLLNEYNNYIDFANSMNVLPSSYGHR